MKYIELKFYRMTGLGGIVGRLTFDHVIMRGMSSETGKELEQLFYVNCHPSMKQKDIEEVESADKSGYWLHKKPLPIEKYLYETNGVIPIYGLDVDAIKSEWDKIKNRDWKLISNNSATVCMHLLTVGKIFDRYKHCPSVDLLHKKVLSGLWQIAKQIPSLGFSVLTTATILCLIFEQFEVAIPLASFLMIKNIIETDDSKKQSLYSLICNGVKEIGKSADSLAKIFSEILALFNVDSPSKLNSMLVELREESFRLKDAAPKLSIVDSLTYYAAKLCEATCFPGSEETTFKDTGWMKITASRKENGYFGMSFCKLDADTKTVIVLIAHRGTQFTDVENLLADFDIMREKRPKLLDFAIKYSNAIKKACQEAYTDKTIKIIHTGFSLGGFLAAGCVIKGVGDEAITFDAPGADFLVDGSLAKDLSTFNVVNYVTAPNIVNTCNKHVGKVKRLSYFAEQKQQLFEKLMLSKGVAVKLLSPSVLAELIKTLESHNMSQIIVALCSNNCIVKSDNVISWPKANFEFTYDTADKLPPISLKSIDMLPLLPDAVIGQAIWNYTNEAGSKVGIVSIYYNINIEELRLDIADSAVAGVVLSDDGDIELNDHETMMINLLPKIVHELLSTKPDKPTQEAGSVGAAVVETHDETPTDSTLKL